MGFQKCTQAEVLFSLIFQTSVLHCIFVAKVMSYLAKIVKIVLASYTQSCCEILLVVMYSCSVNRRKDPKFCDHLGSLGLLAYFSGNCI
jgi:hypothetical protein